MLRVWGREGDIRCLQFFVIMCYSGQVSEGGKGSDLFRSKIRGLVKESRALSNKRHNLWGGPTNSRPSILGLVIS